MSVVNNSLYIKNSFFKKNKVFLSALKETNPIMMGYVPLGLAFGILFTDIGVHWSWAIMMSIFVYAGSAQFMIIPLLLAKSSLLDIALVTFLLNSRHIFYGLSFIDKFSSYPFLKKNYMIFGLTDEAYSVLTTSSNTDHGDFCFYTIFLCHLYWILGSSLGAMIGNLINYDLSFLSFSLIALFIILTIEQAKKVKTFKPFIISGISCIFALFFLPEHMLIIALSFSIGYLLLEYKNAKH